jgi:uncharacterized membrane protein YhhN
MFNTLIIFLAVTLLAALLYFEKTGNQKGKLPAKTILSCLFIFTAVVQSHPTPGYFYMLLIGLVFCLVGDIFLALPREQMFLFGLVSFLLGHVFFIIMEFKNRLFGLPLYYSGQFLMAFSVGAVG